MYIMKKFFLLFIACLIIGYSVSWKLNNKIIINNIKKNEPIVTLKEEEIIIPPLIIEEEKDIKKEEKIVKKTVTPIKRDLNSITAEAYIVGNIQTGEIYIKYNSDKIFPIASLSKLFTSLVSLHILNKESKVTINQKMLDTLGDAGHLKKDEKWTTQELLYPLLLESSNDAAEALAQSFGYSKFIDFMNSFAMEIGMKRSSFKDASGLSSNNISNANDLFILAQYLYKNEKVILDITKLKDITFATTTDHDYHKFVSINPFVYYEPFIGGKTGRTEEAKESMISLFNFNVNNKDSTTTYPIAIIILRSEFGKREIDTEIILDKLSKKI